MNLQSNTIMKKISCLFITIAFAGVSAAARNEVSDTTGFASAASANVAELLRGKVSGVRVSSVDGNPMGSLNINIRGINSLRSDNQPLLIVDGAMLSTDLNQNIDAFWQFGEQSYTAQLNPYAFLDPYEIESIEILKDISATAIYGTRGANGVIIIKTKKAADKENAIQWSSNAGLSLPEATGYLGFNHNHHIAFGGSKGQTAYNLSASIRNTDGIVSRNGSTYGSLKANFDTKTNKYIWFGFNAILSAGESSSPAGVVYLGRPSMTLALRDASLSPMTSFDAWKAEYDDDTKDYRAVSSAFVRVNITPSLYVKASLGFDFQQNQRIIWYGRGTEFGQPSSSNEYGGRASNLFSKLFSYNSDILVSFDRFFGNDHRVTLNADFEFTGNNNQFNTMNGYNFVLDELRGKGLSTGAYEIRHHKYSFIHDHIAASAFASYSYKGIAGINGTFRWDNTPQYKGKESHIYPAVEGFVNFLDNYKMNAGWGRSGLEKFVPYDLFGRYLSGGWHKPLEGTAIFHEGVDRLMTEEWHVGIEGSFFSGRLSAGLTWFDRKTDDIFLMYKLGTPIGDTNVWKWYGCEEVFSRLNTIHNRGYEIDLNASLINTPDWKWQVSANVSINENRATDIDIVDFQGRKVGNGIYANCNISGHQVGALYGYVTDGTGAFKDVTGDGIVNEFDKSILGNTIPLFHGGLQSSLCFGNFTFELDIDGAAGHKIANLQNIVKDGLTDTAGNICVCDKNIEKADFLRIGRIGLAYKVPTKAKWLSDLTLRLSADNVAYLTGYSGYSPDVNCFGNGAISNGIDYGSYPICRTVMLGVSAKF